MFGWDLQQFDVKSFLHGNLEEEVFVELPLGFNEAETDKSMQAEKNVLYGLKQFPCAWFDKTMHF